MKLLAFKISQRDTGNDVGRSGGRAALCRVQVSVEQGSCWARAGLCVEMLGTWRRCGEPAAPPSRARLCQRLPDHLPSSWIALQLQVRLGAHLLPPGAVLRRGPVRVSHAAAQRLRPNCSSLLPPLPRDPSCVLSTHTHHQLDCPDAPRHLLGVVTSISRESAQSREKRGPQLGVSQSPLPVWRQAMIPRPALPSSSPDGGSLDFL